MRIPSENSPISQEVFGFAGAVRRYFGVILSLLRREEDARRHAPFETILAMLEPLTLIAIMTLAMYLLERHLLPPIGNSVLLFYASGFFAKYYFIYVSRRMTGPIRSAQRRFPVEQRLDHIIIHAFMRSVDYAILGVFMFGGIYIFVTADGFPFDFVPIAKACAALVLMGFGFGIINLIMGQIWPMWAYLMPGLNRALILFSGVFYIPDFLPESARYILSFNPLVHAITLFRMGFYPGYPSLILDMNYLMWWVAGTVVFGLMLERVTRRIESR
jgi:capsular polysaccharide transport system permease protein